jgi:hypothetical protein
MKPDTNKHRLYNALKRLVTEAEHDLPQDNIPNDVLLCVIPLAAMEEAYAALRSARLNRRDPDVSNA